MEFKHFDNLVPTDNNENDGPKMEIQNSEPESPKNRPSKVFENKEIVSSLQMEEDPFADIIGQYEQ